MYYAVLKDTLFDKGGGNIPISFKQMEVVPYVIIYLYDHVLYCSMLSFMKVEVASSSLSQRVTVASPFHYTILYHTGLHYTITCLSLICDTVPCSVP